MSLSEAVEEFERGVVAVNPPLAALHEAAGVSGDARMRELAARISFPSWPGVTSASGLKRAAQEAEIFAILSDYAETARELIRPGDQERWQALVAEMQRRSGEGVLADELGRSAVGASLLRARLGGRPQRRQQTRGIPCSCGYAVDGVLPPLVCDECEELLLQRWVAEERRLLRAMPAYATEVVEGLAGVDLRRWSSFITPLSHASTTSVRSTVQKVQKRGLGAAALTELGVRADTESVKAFAKYSEKRKESRWKI